MGNLTGKRILIFQQRGWGIGIGHQLAKRLQADGCILAALTFKRSTHAFTLKQKDVRYDRIVNNDEIMAEPERFLVGAEESLAGVCADLGVETVWPIAMSLRNHVRSYGEKFYYGFTPNVTDEKIAEYLRAIHACAKRFFDYFNPDLVIAPNFVALPHIVFGLSAKRRSIPMMAVTDSKVRGVYLFSIDHNDTNQLLRSRLEALNSGMTKSPNASRAESYVAQMRSKFLQPTTFASTDLAVPFLKRLQQELAPYREIAKWYLRRPVNLLPNIGITADYRPPRIILRDHYAKKAYKRFMDRFDYDDFASIKKFAYVPLQFQPEETIDVKAPFFNNQIETARQVAMSMPDDYVLVVKEHPGMVGYRPPSYIRKIARLVNVKFIDYRIPNDQILKRAGVIISQNSTTIAEAAYFNKPAIQLGNLATTQLLPNVSRHTDMPSISSAIRSALKIDVTSEDYENRLRNFVAAVYDTGFELDYQKLWEEGRDTEEMSNLWSFFRAEIARLLIL